MLAVGDLDITDNSLGLASVEVVRLNSTGWAEARNAVRDLSAPDAELLRIIGDRDLALHIADGGLYSSRDVVDIRANGTGADAFTGNLSLVLAGDSLSTGDGARDRILASTAEGQTNFLALYGDLDVTTGTANGQTEISGFQTIQFGLRSESAISDVRGLGSGLEESASGTFDASALSGVDFVVGKVAWNDALSLLNLEDGAQVAIGDASNAEDQSFRKRTVEFGGREATDDTVDVSILEQAEFGSGFWNQFTLKVGDFTNINLDVARFQGTAAGALDTRYLALELDGQARNLVITGGDADEEDALVLTEALPTTLETIDVSGYMGSFTGHFDNNQNPSSDVTFVIGANDFTFTLTDLVFVPGDPGTPPSDATPTTFVVNFTGGNNSYEDGNGYITFSTNLGNVQIPFTVDETGFGMGSQSAQGTADNFEDAIDGFEAFGGTFSATRSGGSVTVTFTPGGTQALTEITYGGFTGTSGGAAIGGASVPSGQIQAGQDGSPGVPPTPDTYLAGAQFNSIFEFTTDADAVWTIDNFIVGGMDGANINNWSKLDFRAIGLTEDVGVNAVVADWDLSGGDDGLLITADGYDFEIRLVGIFDAGLLTSDNLIFA